MYTNDVRGCHFDEFVGYYENFRVLMMPAIIIYIFQKRKKPSVKGFFSQLHSEGSFFRSASSTLCLYWRERPLCFYFWQRPLRDTCRETFILAARQDLSANDSEDDCNFLPLLNHLLLHSQSPPLDFLIFIRISFISRDYSCGIKFSRREKEKTISPI